LIPNPVISDVLQQDVPLNEMTEALVQLALEAGGHDNITGVLVEFGF
jgi:serine/threonine protein phosphatase PrpC